MLLQKNLWGSREIENTTEKARRVGDWGLMVGKESTYSHATEGWVIRMYIESSTIHRRKFAEIQIMGTYLKGLVNVWISWLTAYTSFVGENVKDKKDMFLSFNLLGWQSNWKEELKEIMQENNSSKYLCNTHPNVVRRKVAW